MATGGNLLKSYLGSGLTFLWISFSFSVCLPHSFCRNPWAPICFLTGRNCCHNHYPFFNWWYCHSYYVTFSSNSSKMQWFVFVLFVFVFVLFLFFFLLCFVLFCFFTVLTSPRLHS